MSGWTPDDVAKSLANPIYCGIGQYPKLVEDTKYIKAGAKLINEIGAKRYIRLLLENLREAFPPPSPERN